MLFSFVVLWIRIFLSYFRPPNRLHAAYGGAAEDENCVPKRPRLCIGKYLVDYYSLEIHIAEWSPQRTPSK
jgi:hypothetical protein